MSGSELSFTNYPFEYINELDLSENKIGDEGAKALTKVIVNLSDMKVFCIHVIRLL